MDGITLAKICDDECRARGISKAQFYKDIGLSAPSCRAHDLPEVGVHGLRHSFASLAYHLGWSEETTMREGGWANPTTVHNIYTHLASQDANKDIVQMQQFFTALT